MADLIKKGDVMAIKEAIRVSAERGIQSSITRLQPVQGHPRVAGRRAGERGFAHEP